MGSLTKCLPDPRNFNLFVNVSFFGSKPRRARLFKAAHLACTRIGRTPRAPFDMGMHQNAGKGCEGRSSLIGESPNIYHSESGLQGGEKTNSRPGVPSMLRFVAPRLIERDATLPNTTGRCLPSITPESARAFVRRWQLFCVRRTVCTRSLSMRATPAAGLMCVERLARVL